MQQNKADRDKEILSDLTDIIGKYGLFQRIIFVFAVTVSVFSAYNNLIITIVAPEQDFWCARPEDYANVSVEDWKNWSIPYQISDVKREYSKCQVYEDGANGSRYAATCRSWEYDDSFYKKTVVQEWDLVCSNSWLISLSQSVYMAGYMTAMILFGQLSDRIGRRPVICCAVTILIAASYSCLVSNSFSLYIAVRYFISLGVSGTGSTAFVLLMETVAPELRTFFGLAFEFGWATGYIILAIIAWLIRDWFYIQVCVAVPCTILAVAYFFIPESPRWLIANKKFDKAHKVVQNAVLKNGGNLAEADAKFKLLKEKIIKENTVTPKTTVLDLLKSENMRKKTLILYLCWFVNSFTYYALSLNTNDLGGNPFINFFIAGAVEFPAYIMCILITKRFGLCIPQTSTMLISGLACLLTIPFTGDYHWLRITFAMLGKFSITASYGILYVYSAEIFPTVVRNVGMGSSSTCARIGAIIAPFVKELGKATHKDFPFAIYGGLCIASGMLVFLLPETKGKRLPDSLEEGEMFGRLGFKFCNRTKKERNGVLPSSVPEEQLPMVDPVHENSEVSLKKDPLFGSVNL